MDEGTHCNKDSGACVDNVCVAMSFQPGKGPNKDNLNAFSSSWEEYRPS